LGSSSTATTGGLLAVDLHLPWEGELRLWEQRLTIPGELDVYGASPIGMPMVLTGFSDQVAWTHLPADGVRATAHQLPLVPGDPTSYLVDGVPQPMVPTTQVVEVGGGVGGPPVEVVEATTWSTDLGPVVALPGIGWTDSQAVVVADAALRSDGMVGPATTMAASDDLTDLQAAVLSSGTPWSDVLAVGADGVVWYQSAAATPSVVPAVERTWDRRRAEDPVVAALADAGIALLDDDPAATDWVAREADGLLAVSAKPSTERTDHLGASGGHWLVQADHPLTGWEPFVGDERTPLEPWARQSLRVLQGLSAESSTGVPLDPTLARRYLMSDASLTGELLADEVVDRCRVAGTVRVSAEQDVDGELLWPAQIVELGEPCEALARWERTFDTEDRGGLLWREMMARFDAADLLDAGELWAEPFDPAFPLDTPEGLAPRPPTGNDPVLVALAEAALTLEAAGLGPDAALREAQFAMRGDERIAVHGGHGGDGTIAGARFAPWSSSLEPGIDGGAPVASSGRVTDRGAPVNLGSSFLMVVVLADAGASADAVLAYGESGDPLSPYFADQTYRYGDEAWRTVVFGAVQPAPSTERTEQVVRGVRAPG
jgi:acyl-homoserine-lactone acylase